MQNRYVGDVGDFGKYGLLDFIASETKLKLGVTWCLTSPTEKEKKSLQKIIRERDEGSNTEFRCVKQIEDYKILPKGTIFYGKELKEN